ncbi:DUF6603 domain-containing protein [Adhaeribacter soli]|uniref:DUF6603 domain-containing protein n=1 Tax=Adhaeribacter soli TaxID=2607655 RepID=A0A5N1IWT3_9BACT|nr:DUF6603 domain-containing protein [Adhaeribacter soli]KAA9338975.1 hypothetical protein F0P94_09295 [Adhaeribacter soli]
MEILYNFPPAASDKVLALDSIRLSLLASNSGIKIASTASGKVKLGPITAIVEQVGLGADLTFPSNGGNLGPINADIGFAPPKGIGLKIDSEAVKGGGYLFFDVAKGQYAGVAELNVKDKINLKAIGILTTKNDPVTGADYSLLLIITAEFKPIQLGLGFTLQGVGGLIGLNRSINEQRLRQGVQDGSLNHLLFPVYPVNNAAQIIAAAGQAFPVANGRYAFGLMGKIGWGAPELITLDVGLVIEVPSPVKLAILGVLRALLPNKDKPILKLQVNFLGVIDFDKKQIKFDASLFDSKILNYALTGDMAFRLYQGEKPVFLITAGGFHPGFTPPPNADLPNLRRLTLVIANSNNFKLILTSYFAVTSNTVQFGSRMDLRAELPGPFVLEGFFSFDALFQFNPFQLQFDTSAGVAIKKGSKSLLSLHLNLHVKGPSPWHITGEGKFKVLFIKVSFDIDKTFGHYEETRRLDDVNVKDKMVAALRDMANWEVITGPKSYDLVTIKEIEPSPGRLFINPAGELVVRQKVAPLRLHLQRFGNSRPVNGNNFDITGAEFGEGANKLTLTAAELTEKKDFFSISQFQDLSDQSKLTSPSFQRFRNGVGFKVTEEYLGGPGHAKAFDYELVILEAEDDGALVADPGAEVMRMASSSTTSTSSSTTGAIRQPYTMSPNLFNGLARNSSVSKSDLSQERISPSRHAPDAVYWDEDRYAVVKKTNLEYYGEEQEFDTEAEAYDYLRELLSLEPHMEHELQVIPTYQLETV